MTRVITAMSAACLSAAAGQILVRRGMQQLGPLESWAPRQLLAYFWHALTNPWVAGGTVGNALFYFLFLAVLSWSEVTVALPLTALEYAFAAVLSIIFLKEVVPPLRWAGIALVIAGVALIGIEQRQSRTGGSGDPAQRGLHSSDHARTRTSSP
ncbi:MAG TPA: DMT family transporter [Thermoanaerobaculia bacterium]|nr:DMT family transporter [Thermoanaerobaculia bacterium]